MRHTTNWDIGTNETPEDAAKKLRNRINKPKHSIISNTKWLGWLAIKTVVFAFIIFVAELIVVHSFTSTLIFGIILVISEILLLVWAGLQATKKFGTHPSKGNQILIGESYKHITESTDGARAITRAHLKLSAIAQSSYKA